MTFRWFKRRPKRRNGSSKRSKWSSLRGLNGGERPLPLLHLHKHTHWHPEEDPSGSPHAEIRHCADTLKLMQFTLCWKKGLTTVRGPFGGNPTPMHFHPMENQRRTNRALKTQNRVVRLEENREENRQGRIVPSMVTWLWCCLQRRALISPVGT